MRSQFNLPPTQEPYLPLLPATKRHHPLAGTYCAYPRRDGQAELTVHCHMAMQYVWMLQQKSTCSITTSPCGNVSHGDVRHMALYVVWTGF